MSSDTDFKRELEVAKKASAEASVVLRQYFRTTIGVEQKLGERGLVTEADRMAEVAILTVLRQESSYPILSEEAGASGEDGTLQWVVDPLDGTTNFVRGVPLFAVSIALVDGFRVRLGVIVDVMNGLVYSATENSGVIINDTPIHRPNSADRSPAIFVNHGYAVADRKRAAEVTNRLIETATLRRFGSTALELTHVTIGTIDAFICSGDEYWDYAAGLLLAAESGCLVSDWKGAPWDGSSSYVLISEPRLHRSLVEAIADLQE